MKQVVYQFPIIRTDARWLSYQGISRRQAEVLLLQRILWTGPRYQALKTLYRIQLVAPLDRGMVEVRLVI